MGISIKNDKVEELARELATRRGISLTEAIRVALEHEVIREREAGARKIDEKRRAIYAIIEKNSSLPRLTDASEDEILGYDEVGAPTR